MCWEVLYSHSNHFFSKFLVISITPTKIEYGMANETAYCDKLKYNIYRRRPKHCMSYHAEETEIKLCGRASFGASCLSPLLLILCVLLRYVFLSPSISSSGSLEYNTNARLLWFCSRSRYTLSQKYCVALIWFNMRVLH